MGMTIQSAAANPYGAYLNVSGGVLGLTLGQLAFPASQNASADANTLDDYEEGTWTPTFSATSSVFSYAVQVGTYEKIGRLVWVQAAVNLNTSGNTLTANLLSIASLPFTSTNRTNQAQMFQLSWFAATSSYVSLVGILDPNLTSASVKGATAAATGNITNQNASAALHATNGSWLWMEGCYQSTG